MRSSLFAIVAGVSAVAFAQDLSGLPKCAQTCVGNGLATTGCTNLDIACICNSRDWITQLSCCVSQACSPADQQATINFASQLCSTKGITTLPTSAACSGTSTSAGSSATGNSTSPASSNATVTSTSTTATGATGSSSSRASSASAASSAGAEALGENLGMGLGMAAAGLIAAVL